MVHVEDLFPMEADIVVDDFGKVNEAFMIESVRALEPHVVHIAGEIVELVSINTVLCVCDDIVQKGGLQGATTSLWSDDEVGNMSYVNAVDVDLILVNEMLEHHDRASLVVYEGMVGLHSVDVWEKVGIEKMGKGAMA